MSLGWSGLVLIRERSVTPFRIHLQPSHPCWKGTRNWTVYVLTRTHTTNTKYLKIDESRIVRIVIENWSVILKSSVLYDQVALPVILSNHLFYVCTRKQINFNIRWSVGPACLTSIIYSCSKLKTWIKWYLILDSWKYNGSYLFSCITL